MTASDQVLAIAIIVAATLGVVSSLRLYLRYRNVSPRLVSWRERLMLGTFAGLAWLVTIVAIWVGFLIVRRLSGLPPLEGSAPVTGLLTVVILLIPLGLDLVVTRISRR